MFPDWRQLTWFRWEIWFGRVLARFAPPDSPIISEQARRRRGAASGFRPASHSINGIGKQSRSWVHALEAATSRNDLRFLTLLPFREILPHQGLLFRRAQAWCPQCLHQRGRERKAAYLPLLWSLRPVTICALHGQPLLELCPYCSRSFGPLLANSRPGYCGHCRRWLGTSCPTAQSADPSRTDTDLRVLVDSYPGGTDCGCPSFSLVSPFLPRAQRQFLVLCTEAHKVSSL